METIIMTDAIQLLEATKELDRAMSSDGQAVQSGLLRFLQEYKVGRAAEVAKYLKENKVVGYSNDGSKARPLIFWNVKFRPSLKWCEKVYETIDAQKARNKDKKKAVKKEKEPSFFEGDDSESIGYTFETGNERKFIQPDPVDVLITDIRREFVEIENRYNELYTVLAYLERKYNVKK